MALAYWEVPTQFGQRGVDVAIEASGSVAALHYPYARRWRWAGSRQAASAQKVS